MSDEACCAHLRVGYQTVTNHASGLTTAHWACGDCGTIFAPSTPLSQTAQAIAFLIQQGGGDTALTMERLAAMLYMADVIARQYTGKPITDLTWVNAPDAGGDPEGVDPAGMEWERVTRAAWSIHVDWTARDRRVIEDFILTVRHTIADVLIADPKPL